MPTNSAGAAGSAGDQLSNAAKTEPPCVYKHRKAKNTLHLAVG